MWTFHPPNRDNPFFGNADPTFKGTYTMDAEGISPSTLIRFEVEDRPADLKNWINQRYLKGSAVLLKQRDLSKNTQLYIYQIHQDLEVRWICVYAQKMDSQKIVLLSYEGPEEEYKAGYLVIHQSILKLLLSK